MVKDGKAGSAAKLIVDALLQRFLPLARRRIETAQAQVQFFLLFSPLENFMGSSLSPPPQIRR